MMCENVFCEKHLIVPSWLRTCDLSESNLNDYALKICIYQFFFVPLHAKCVQQEMHERNTIRYGKNTNRHFGKENDADSAA